MLRVRALGCFFEVPASYTLIADSEVWVQFIAPLARGSVTIEPHPARISRDLSEVSSRTRGHLTIAELTDHHPREPLTVTVIHNALQSVVLQRAARDLESTIIDSCLANIHPGAPGAP
jgi:hypothetical protein